MDLEKEVIYDTDVLVMGTDGLWDVTTNERVAEVVARCLEQFPSEDQSRHRYRFTSAAQDLVMCSRGKLSERSWRTTADNKAATIDDISVFVIPIAPYKEEYLRWKREREPLDNNLEPDDDKNTANEISPTLEPSGYVSFPSTLPDQVVLDSALQDVQDIVLDGQAEILPSSDKEDVISVNTAPAETTLSLEAATSSVPHPDTATSTSSA